MAALYIDADACPVKAEAERVATRHRLKMYVVSNGGLRPSANPLVENVIVAEGADEADKCVEAGARVLRHNGEAFTKANIGQQLAMRDLMADIRAANPLGAGGGGRGFTKADRSRFLDALEREIRAATR